MEYFIKVTQEQLFTELSAEIISDRGYTPVGLRLIDVCRLGYGAENARTPRMLIDGMYLMDTTICCEGMFDTRNAYLPSNATELAHILTFLGRTSTDLIPVDNYWDYESYVTYDYEEEI